MGISGGPKIVRDSSLILELDAADRNSYQSGSTMWFDLTGNSHNFLGTGSYGFSNNAVVFNRAGTNGSLFTLSNTPTPLKIETILAGSHTLEVWLLPQTLSGSNVDASEAGNYVIIWPGYHNGVIFNEGGTAFQTVWPSNLSPSGMFSLNATASFLSTGSYTHLVTTVNRTTTSSVGYLNGNAVITTGSVPTLPTMTSAQGVPANTLSIGAARNTSNYKGYYTGSIAVVKIYNRALTQAEVQQNYNQLKSRFNL